MKKLIITTMLLVVCLVIAACSSVQDETPTLNKSEGDSEYSTYPEAFVSACADTNIDVSQVKNWEQIDDWNNGQRFRFSYKQHAFVVYINYDETISSIELGGSTGTAIFKSGYVPYNVDDYLVDIDTAESLIPYAEDIVKNALNYPSTADFSLLDWSYGRKNDLYQLQSSVTAKNAFGVQNEIPFTVIFDLGTKNKINCVYLEIAGNVISNDLPEEPEREVVQTEASKSNTVDGIHLIYGKIGDYGKQDPKYPEYIDYYIPAGRYTVKNNTKNSIVMIIDNASNDEVSRVTLTKNQSGELKIESNQHIELVIYSDVTLNEISE